MTEKEIHFTSYGLGLEELALCMGLINRPDLGRDLLASIYPQITAAESDTRLSAASHSLLARELCALNANGQPVLDDKLEKALLPLVKFDRMFQISLVSGKNQSNMIVYARKDDTFTARTIKAGVANVLDHGPSHMLAGYFGAIFEQAHGNIAGAIQGKITPGMLGKALASAKNQAECGALLTAQGWTAEHAAQLCEDLANQVFRVTLIRIESGDKDSPEKIKSANHRNLMLLKGKTRAWGFAFKNTRDDSAGKVWRMDAETLANLFVEFTA